MTSDASLRFLEAPGPTAALMRAHDWRGSPLGAPATWPPSLRSVVSLMLRSKFPMVVAWGPALSCLYNDAYAAILGAKHPSALGQPFPAVWPEIWADVEPLVTRALAGEASYLENMPLTLRRQGFDERTWFTLSASPVLDDHGDIAGMYCACTETTASMLAKRARQAQMRRLTSLFAQAPGFVAVTRGREHVYEIANPAYLRFVGREHIVGLSVRDALPELDQKFIDQLTRVLDTGEPYIGRRVPVGLQRGPDGTIEDRIVDFVFQPITAADGRVDGIFIQGTDITDQAAAERAAQTERRRLDAVIDSLPSGIALADADGAITRMNAAGREIWGEHPLPTDVAGFGDRQGWWADDSERRGQPLHAEDWPLVRALRGEVVRGDVVEIQPFDDQPRRTLLVQATPIRLDNGELAGAVAAQTDISARVQVEAELRASEARFRTITDAMPQMVWSTRPDGYHDYFNRQWYDYTGLPAGSTDGDGWAGVFHPEDQPEAWSRWRHSLATGEDYEIQYRLRHRSGEYRWVLGRAVPVRDAHGRILRWLGTCTDIQDQRLAQDALEHSERALRDADRRKDEFLAMLAHELRNPLAPISTASQLLLRATDPLQVRAAGEIIGRQVRHMTELVDDLLDVSRVTRGLVTLERTTLDLRDVIASAIEQVRPLVDARGHALHTRLPAEALWVHGDATRLTQILANLLNNAAKYTADGGELRVDVQREAGRITVHVRDTGQGIDAALLPQIFDLFRQAERTPDRSQGGLGIGLALVRSLVALHGGTITAESAGRGHGATFTVCLPEAGPPESDATAARTHAAPPTTPLDVLVVDDNVDAAQTLQSLLAADGHRVRVFHRGQDALDAVLVQPADVAFLDIGLPDMTGHELARQIRARLGARAGVLIALSGYGQPQDLEASRAAGLDRHLVKPIDHATVLDVLARARDHTPRSR